MREQRKQPSGDDGLFVYVNKGDVQGLHLPASSYMVQFGRAQTRPLIGREPEIAHLQQQLLVTEQCLQILPANRTEVAASSWTMPPRASCVMLAGDAGIGKTRLAEEISREAWQRDWSIIWSQAYAQESHVPYRLWTDVVRKIIKHELWQPTAEGLHSSLYQPLLTLLPELAALFQQEVPPASSSQQEPLRLWEAIYALLVEACQQMAMLLVLDDLQWMDSSSYELLGYLIRHISGHPILLVGTYREKDSGSEHVLSSLIAHLQRERLLSVLRIPVLTDEQIARLVATQVPEPLIQPIQRQAAGNPFFAEELARVCSLEEGVDSRKNVSAPHVSGSALPTTITAVLDQRLRRLSSACRQFLGRAAVLGSSLSFSLLQAMEGDSRAAADEDRLCSLIDEALQAGVFTEEESGKQVTYHFWHPLLMSYLYDTLSGARRTVLHQRASRVLQQVYAGHEEEGAAAITHHLVQGGADPERIAHYARLAGDRSYALSAYSEAERYYSLVFKHMGYRECHRTALASGEDLEVIYFLERLGECLRIQGKFAEARRIYEQALEISRPALSGSQRAKIQALLWCEIGATWYGAGNVAQAQQCFAHCAPLLHDIGITSGPLWAYLRYRQSFLYWREGSYEEAWRSALSALKAFEEVVERDRFPAHAVRIERILAGDPVHIGGTHALLGIIANATGRSGEALKHLSLALALYEERGFLRESAGVCCNLGDLHMRRAEHDLARAFFLRSWRAAERVSEMPLVFFVFGNLGILDTRVGNLLEAERELQQAALQAERIADSVSLANIYAYLAVALQEQGKLADACRTLKQALALARKLPIIPYIGLSLVILGNIRLAQARAASLSTRPEGRLEEKRMLQRARKTLLRALRLEGIEAETRTEGRLALAQVFYLLGDIHEAHQQAILVLENVLHYELLWLLARAQSLLGCIQAARCLWGEAEQYFAQAIKGLRARGMHLEYARALCCYGEALLTQDRQIYPLARQRGLSYLREAHRLLGECQAQLDLQYLENLLISHAEALFSEYEA